MSRVASGASAAIQTAVLKAAEDSRFVDRFWARVQRGENCWLWTGGKSGAYGQLTVAGRRVLAHRASWLITNKAALSVDKVVRHTCDTPLCVRPEHLVAGSAAQNVRDTYERNRRRSGTWSGGTSRPNAVLDDQVVTELRRAVRGGRSIRSLALEIGVAYTTAHRAIRGIGWSHVTEPAVPKFRKYPSKNIGFVHNNPAIATRARTLSEQGLSLRAIADELGITRAAAFRCCRTQAEEAAS